MLKLSASAVLVCHALEQVKDKETTTTTPAPAKPELPVKTTTTTPAPAKPELPVKTTTTTPAPAKPELPVKDKTTTPAPAKPELPARPAATSEPASCIGLVSKPDTEIKIPRSKLDATAGVLAAIGTEAFKGNMVHVVEGHGTLHKIQIKVSKRSDDMKAFLEKKEKCLKETEEMKSKIKGRELQAESPEARQKKREEEFQKQREFEEQQQAKRDEKLREEQLKALQEMSASNHMERMKAAARKHHHNMAKMKKHEMSTKAGGKMHVKSHVHHESAHYHCHMLRNHVAKHSKKHKHNCHKFADHEEKRKRSMKRMLQENSVTFEFTMSSEDDVPMTEEMMKDKFNDAKLMAGSLAESKENHDAFLKLSAEDLDVNKAVQNNDSSHSVSSLSMIAFAAILIFSSV